MLIVVSCGDSHSTPFLTTTTTGAEVVALPTRSRATAVTEYVPSDRVVLSQLKVYGNTGRSGLTGVPFTLNCTPATATLSDAFAVSGTMPDTSPAAGAVIDTVGGVTSAATKVTCKYGRRLAL